MAERKHMHIDVEYDTGNEEFPFLTVHKVTRDGEEVKIWEGSFCGPCWVLYEKGDETLVLEHASA